MPLGNGTTRKTASDVARRDADRGEGMSEAYKVGDKSFLGLD